MRFIYNLRLKRNYILIPTLILFSCASKKPNYSIDEIKYIQNYAQSTKPGYDKSNYHLNLRTEKLNDDGTEYRIFFTTDKNQLVRVKYLSDKISEKTEMNFYYENDTMILATFEDRILNKNYSIYLRDNKTIFDCCGEYKPIKNLNELGLLHFTDYKRASI